MAAAQIIERGNQEPGVLVGRVRRRLKCCSGVVGAVGSSLAQSAGFVRRPGTSRRLDGSLDDCPEYNKEGNAMALWLFKEEPDHYSFADLQRDGSTLWTGVSN